MKIGILTQTLHNNYGGLLQNYALQQVLIHGGHTPCTIDHSRTVRISALRQMTRKSKAYVKHLLLPNRYTKPAYVANEKEEAFISKNTEYFIDKYIRRTKRLETHEEFQDIAKSNEFQAYVVGSDQCWRPRYNKSFLKEMFLDFAEQQECVKRIAYAASFGTDEWDLAPETMLECARLAKKFDLVTVREKSGVDLCRKHLGVEAHHVLDPTMLLSKEDYIRLFEDEREPESPGNLFYYILDPSGEKTKLVDSVAFQIGLEPFTVMPKHSRDHRSKSDIKNHIEDCIYPSVTSWLRAFRDAEMTIVDSFHGMVFSIIFNKPFWLTGNTNRGMSRFVSLLKLFDLEDRLIDLDLNKLDDIDWKKTIDWERVNSLKEKYADYSTSLLYEALKL